MIYVIKLIMNYQLIPNNEIFFNNIITYLNMETLFELLRINKYHNITIKNKILDYILLKISNFFKIEPNILKQILSGCRARITGSFIFSCFLDIFKKQTSLKYNKNLNIVISLSTRYKKENKQLYNYIENYKQNDILTVIILPHTEFSDMLYFKINRKELQNIYNIKRIYTFGNKCRYKNKQLDYYHLKYNYIEINDDFLIKNKIVIMENKLMKEDDVIITPSYGTTLLEIAIVSSIVIGFIYLINKSK